MLGLSFTSKMDPSSYIVSVVDTISKKVEALIFTFKSIYSEVMVYIYKSIFWHAWNTLVFSVLVFIITT